MKTCDYINAKQTISELSIQH